MARPPTLSGVIISGIILAGIPLVAIAQHLHVNSQDLRFQVPSTLTPTESMGNMSAVTEINTLDLDELAGANYIRQWDTIYVHFALGPELIAYPFAVSTEKPEVHRDELAFSLRGTVTAKKESIITVHYNFENFLLPTALRSLEGELTKVETKVEIAVNSQSVARLAAIEVNGVRYPYRVIEKPVLKGLTK